MNSNVTMLNWHLTGYSIRNSVVVTSESTSSFGIFILIVEIKR